MSREALFKLIEDLYSALYSEYVYCPFCSGHIGSGNENHDAYCVLYKALIENGHKFTFSHKIFTGDSE